MDLEIKKDNLLEKATIRSSGRVKFLLSKKVILVEGPTEYLLIPEMYIKEFNKTLEESRHLDIAGKIDKMVCVITDSDGEVYLIEKVEEHNELP